MGMLFPPWGHNKNVVTLSGLKPRGTFSIERRVRKNRLAAIRRTVLSPTSAATSQGLRRCCCLTRPPLPPRRTNERWSFLIKYQEGAIAAVSPHRTVITKHAGSIQEAN